MRRLIVVCVLLQLQTMETDNGAMHKQLNELVSRKGWLTVNFGFIVLSYKFDAPVSKY